MSSSLQKNFLNISPDSSRRMENRRGNLRNDLRENGLTRIDPRWGFSKLDAQFRAAWAVTIALGVACPLVGAEDAPNAIAIEPHVHELFLDDAGIDQMHGLRRTLHSPERQPANPLVQADQQGELHINVDATGGEVQAVLADVVGKVLADCPASGKVEGDQLDAIVPFAASDLANLAGRQVRLRLTAKNARIFSYWFAPARR